MKKVNVPQEFLALIGADNAKAVKAALDRNMLTQKWLILRLDQDWGLKVKPSEMSELLMASVLSVLKCRRWFGVPSR